MATAFLAAGGTGNLSIDKFVREDLANHASERYSNSHLLLDSTGALLGFASNSMGTVRLSSQELMGRNMEVVPEVPAMFLHRLGVVVTQRRKGLARLMMLRVFETLKHVCSHTAACCVALYVDPDNAEAKSLYEALAFQQVETTKKNQLMILGYAEAIEHVSVFERALRDSRPAPVG